MSSDAVTRRPRLKMRPGVPWPARELPRRPNRAQASEPEPLPVLDNWPVIVPVTPAEIDVIETYFADLLDEILGKRK